MLDPRYLRDVPESIAEYFDELETRILKDIARRISQNDYMMTSTAEYQIHKLEELGVSMLEIEQAIADPEYNGYESKGDHTRFLLSICEEGQRYGQSSRC